jgi:zinc protease
MNLREKHGYSYGASSVFDMRVVEGPFYATAGVQTDKTSESLTEFFNELKAIAETVPADELSRAKNYVALRFPERFEATSDIASNLETLLVYHLPDDYFSKYVQNIEAVTAANVQAMARKYVQPDRFAVVVVWRPQDDRTRHSRAQSRYAEDDERGRDSSGSAIGTTVR